MGPKVEVASTQAEMTGKSRSKRRRLWLRIEGGDGELQQRPHGHERASSLNIKHASFTYWQNSQGTAPLSLPWFSSVIQACLTLCDPMDRSTPGFPVHHQLPELTFSLARLISLPKWYEAMNGLKKSMKSLQVKRKHYKKHRCSYLTS